MSYSLRTGQLAVGNFRLARSVALIICVAAWSMTLTRVARSDRATIDFNRDVRAILSDKCFLCHGPSDEMREADLRLDQRSTAVTLGAIVPGDPSASELVSRVTSRDPEVRMPPPSTGKTVTREEAELLKQWISEDANYADHWAFVSPRRPRPPQDASGWAQNPIDQFIHARRRSVGLTASPEADAATLVRRVYLAITGLPPTPQQVNRFLAQKDKDAAYNRLVDRLLQSQHFGERWARWWLDAARYSDSDGYEKDKQRSVWFYRDWVIDAFNNDMPYDDFVVWQIAGDLLPDAGQSEVVATGFLRNSMVNEEGGADPEQFRVEAMFDRIDAVGKAILGITTQCAQCHTHKYDPLSQREYYQMFASLNDFHEATTSVYTSDEQKRKQSIDQQIAAIEAALKRKASNWKQRLRDWSKQASNDMVDWRTIVPTDRPFEGQKFRVLDDGSILSESYAPTQANNTFSLTIDPCTITAFRLDALTHPQLPRGGPGRSIYGTGALSEFEVTIAPVDDPETKQDIKFGRAIADVNPDHATLLPIYRIKDASNDDRVTGPVEYAVDGDPKTAWTTDDGPAKRNTHHYAVFVTNEPVKIESKSTLSITLRQLHGGWNSDDNQNYLLGRYRFSITDAEQLPETAIPPAVEQCLATEGTAADPKRSDQLFGYWRTTIGEFADANRRIEALMHSYPETDTQLVVSAMSERRPTHVFKRGDFLSRGENVTPGAPSFLNEMPDTDEPARLRFARWLVADDSPTAARVIVNRIWQEYFGRGIVTTPEDFGFQSSAPTHPDLLDWLAVELMENDWRLTHIHQLIATSATYRQSAKITSEHTETDPNNEFLARGPRFRANAEMVRDIALASSGLLNPAVGGPSIYPPAPDFLFQPPASYGPKIWNLSTAGQQYRRSLYVHSYRSVPFPTLHVFDAPKGDAACIRRARSNTPLQALVVLNEPQFVECARAMATRVLVEGGDSDESRLKYAFQLCVSRTPTQLESGVLQRLLAKQRTRIEQDEIDLSKLLGVSPSLYQQLAQRSAAEYAPWIVVCRAILNLDETISIN